MGALLKMILGLLVPPDPCPWDLVPGAQGKDKVQEVHRDMRRWQLGISGILAAAVVVIVASFTTPYGFAVAGDTTKQTTEAVKPLAESVQKIEGKLIENERANKLTLAALNELRAVAVADGLDRLLRHRCTETDVDELQALRRAIVERRKLYLELSGQEYDEPTCTELRRQ